MKPTICSVCKRQATATGRPDKGDWVAFADYDATSAQQPTGYRSGLKWFCCDHVDAALLLSHLPLGEALSALQDEYDIPTSLH